MTRSCGALPFETATSVAAYRDRQYDLLAAHYAEHLDLDELSRIAGVDFTAARGSVVQR